MSSFDGVSVTREANVYFDGKVTSRTVTLANGEKKTLGVMLPGEYEFGTADSEIMDILSGELEVQLPGDDVWTAVSGGGQFEVAANVTFSVKVTVLVDYCCSYG